MVIVTGEIRVTPDSVERLRPAMRAMLEASRAEAGCLLYAFGEDVLDPGLIRIVERWQDAAALAAHGATRHMAAWRAALKETGVSGRDVWAHDAANGRAI